MTYFFVRIYRKMRTFPSKAHHRHILLPTLKRRLPFSSGIQSNCSSPFPANVSNIEASTKSQFPGLPGLPAQYDLCPGPLRNLSCRTDGHNNARTVESFFKSKNASSMQKPAAGTYLFPDSDNFFLNFRASNQRFTRTDRELKKFCSPCASASRQTTKKLSGPTSRSVQ